MTGQLNTNLLNSNSEEIQEELDTLSNRLDGVESVTSANTDKINEVDNKVDNLASCVSTDSLKATNVAACNIQGSSATITDINANNITQIVPIQQSRNHSSLCKPRYFIVYIFLFSFCLFAR